MPEVGLQGSGINAVIGELIAAAVAQHVRMNLELEAGRLASSGNELLETRDRERRAALGDEDEGRGIGFPPQAPHGSQLAARERMRRWSSILEPPDMQDACFEADLVPTKAHQLSHPQAVPVGQQQHRGVPMPITVRLGGLDQPLDLLLGGVRAHSKKSVRATPRRYCP